MIKLILILFLTTMSTAFDLPDIVLKLYQAGKTIKNEGNKAPPLVEQYFKQKWGKEIQEWKRVSHIDTTAIRDTVVIKDTIYVQKDTIPKPPSNSPNIVIKEDDLLLRIQDGEFKDIILWEE